MFRFNNSTFRPYTANSTLFHGNLPFYTDNSWVVDIYIGERLAFKKASSWKPGVPHYSQVYYFY